jgi:hypothetical protein
MIASGIEDTETVRYLAEHRRQPVLCAYVLSVLPYFHVMYLKMSALFPPTLRRRPATVSPVE